MKSKYDDMPLCYIQNPLECSKQIAKRIAKSTIHELEQRAKENDIEITNVLMHFKNEINKALQEYKEY